MKLLLMLKRIANRYSHSIYREKRLKMENRETLVKEVKITLNPRPLSYISEYSDTSCHWRVLYQAALSSYPFPLQSGSKASGIRNNNSPSHHSRWSISDRLLPRHKIHTHLRSAWSCLF